MRGWLVVVILFLAIFCVCGTRYNEALAKAARKEIDDEVINVFHTEHAEAETDGDLARRLRIKINLGALLLDVANENAHPDEYMDMYGKCEELSKEALQIDVRSTSLCTKNAMYFHYALSLF